MVSVEIKDIIYDHFLKQPLCQQGGEDGVKITGMDAVIFKSVRKKPAAQPKFPLEKLGEIAQAAGIA
jgi:hypothetical protein